MENEIKYLYLDDIIPNRFQPREKFDEQALKELAVSISEHGVIQPIVVRQIGEKYEIIAGERRYKASTMAGLTQIPAIVRNLDDKESSKVALIENLQRKDLTPIEEARTYQKILELDSLTQEELARTMGKVQSSVSNKLRLLSLTDEAQDALINEKISERHARALLNITDPQKQREMVNRIIEKRITVREWEEEIKKMNETQSAGTEGSAAEQKVLENTTTKDVALVEPNIVENTDNSNAGIIPNQDIIPNIMPMDVMPTASIPTTPSAMPNPTPTVEKPQVENDEIITVEKDNEVETPKVTEEKPSFNSENLFSNLDLPPELPTPSNNSEFDVIGGSGMLAGMTPNETVVPQDKEPQVPETGNNLFGISSINGTASNTDQLPQIDNSGNSDIQNDNNQNITVPGLDSQNVVVQPNANGNNSVKDIPTIVSEFNDIVNNVKSSGKRVEMEEFDFDDFYQLVIRIDK